MKSLIATTILTAVALAGCAKTITSSEIAGSWVNEGPSQERRELALGNDGRFEVKRFPAALACSDSGVTGDVDGNGTWEYESEDDRVFLKFSKVTNKRCATPSGVLIFRQPGEKLSAFLDVERPSSAIVFERRPP